MLLNIGAVPDGIRKGVYRIVEFAIYHRVRNSYTIGLFGFSFAPPAEMCAGLLIVTKGVFLSGEDDALQAGNHLGLQTDGL